MIMIMMMATTAMIAIPYNVTYLFAKAASAAATTAFGVVLLANTRNNLM